MTDDELITALGRRGNDADAPLRPVARAADVDRIEERVGLRLPPLLHRIYLEIADGGFGPGCGILPLAPESDGDGVVSTFEMLGRPRPLVPLIDLGCACWALIDTRIANSNIILLHQGRWIDHGRSLRSFLDDWITLDDFDASVFEPDREVPGVNPFTKKPMMIRKPGPVRGAPWADVALVAGPQPSE